VSSEEQPRTPEEIRSDIEDTREELGDTVEAMAAKTDVKARVQDRVESVKTTVHEKAEQAPPSAQPVMDTARENWMPLAGVAALAFAYWLGRRSARP
jgi:hypothetical protein